MTLPADPKTRLIDNVVPIAPNASSSGHGGVYLMLLATMVFWGGAWVAGRYAVGESPPFMTALLRFGMATAVLLPWALARREIPKSRRQWRTVVLLGLTGIFLYNASFFTGLQYTTATNGALIVAATPAITALLATLFLGERFRMTQRIGFAVSMAGVVMVVSNGSWETIAAMSLNRGDLILLAAPVLWALYSVLGRRLLFRLSPLGATAWAVGTGTLMLAPAALGERMLGAPSPHLSPAGWIAIVYMALFATVAGFLWWYGAIRRIGAGRAAVFVNLVPPATILMAWPLLGEKPTLPQFMGGCLVIGGVLLVQRNAR